MSITKKLFDKLNNGSEVYVYRITNKTGAYVEILNYGGILHSLMVPDRDGNLADVLVGFDNIQGYIDTEDAYYGALIGRVGNRIRNGKFTLNGKEYQLAINNGPNHLHGGTVGFNAKIWDTTLPEGEDGNKLELNLLSPDGEENYPGNLNVKVVYTFDDNNSLEILYKAETDADTIVNMTNHAYFNLEGHNQGCICHHKVKVNAEQFIRGDDFCCTTDEIIDVEETPLDLREEKELYPGLQTEGTDPDITAGGGYDHNYILNKAYGEFGLAATAYAEKTGIFMEVYTDQPGMQLYTGNFMSGDTVGKDGYVYKKRGAFCMETQHYPDSINHPEWPSIVLKPGEVYTHRTVYTFKTK
ncbi:MAG: galactose mutarotase [Ruminococcaceae bacterium]|nr:galactose mutarotase [Oscillospiraceae bacterium]